MTTPQEGGITQAIFGRGTLMHLRIGRWTANRRLHASDMLMEETVDSDAIYLGHKKLLPKKALVRLATLESEARTTLAQRSYPFPISNARFVSNNALRVVLDKLEAQKEEWDRAVEELIQAYPEYKAEQLLILNRQTEAFAAEALQKVLPNTPAWNEERQRLDTWVERQKAETLELYPKDEQELRTKFAFQWRLFTISQAEGLQQVSAEEMREAQRRLQEDLRAWVQEASIAMHRTLGEAARNASNLLEKNGKLTPRNLRPLFEAFETFASVNFTGAGTFQQVIDELKTRYLVNDSQGQADYSSVAAAVNDPGGGFAELLAQVSSLATGSVAEQAGIEAVSSGEFHRFIDV